MSFATVSTAWSPSTVTSRLARLIEGEQRKRLALKGLQALGDRFRGVVASLNHRSSALFAVPEWPRSR